MKLLYGVDVLDGLKTLHDKSVHCCVTSPPYWGLRDYGKDGQIGLEKTPEEFVQKLVSVFREVKRVLKDDGTLFLVLGDSYSGSGKGGGPGELSSKQKTNIGSLNMGEYGGNIPEGLKAKDLVGIPWMVAFALRADGWYLRQDIIWHKPNPMPESVTDRCTKSHEYIFLLSKSARYYFDQDAIKEEMATFENRADGIVRDRVLDYDSKLKILRRKASSPSKKAGKESNISIKNQQKWVERTDFKRNKRSVWTVTTKGYHGAHFATFPQDLIIPMIQAGCPSGGVVLDPFSGSGTTGEVSLNLGRDFIGIDINKDYEKLARERIGLFV